jgi:hypothetical protein
MMIIEHCLCVDAVTVSGLVESLEAVMFEGSNDGAGNLKPEALYGGTLHVMGSGIYPGKFGSCVGLDLAEMPSIMHDVHCMMPRIFSS